MELSHATTGRTDVEIWDHIRMDPIGEMPVN